MGLREDKFREKFFSAFVSSLLPSGLNLLAILWWNHMHQNMDVTNAFLLYVAFAGALMSLSSYVIYYKIVPKIKCLRELYKYEGRWIEIIPDYMDRHCSIIDFTYNKASLKYELIGYNFRNDLQSGIEFKAYKFIERTFRDGFYFITNETSEHKNGLGKIAFVKSNVDNLTRAIGYFFDSSNDNCSRKYETILIKCDRNFYEHVCSRHKCLNKKKLTPLDIAEMSQELVKSEVEKYRAYKNVDSFCCGRTQDCRCQEKT